MKTYYNENDLRKDVVKLIKKKKIIEDSPCNGCVFSRDCARRNCKQFKTYFHYCWLEIRTLFGTATPDEMCELHQYLIKKRDRRA